MTTYNILHCLRQNAFNAAAAVFLLSFFSSCADRPKEAYRDTSLSLSKKLYMKVKPEIDSLTELLMSLDVVKGDFDGKVEEITVEDILSEKVINDMNEEKPLEVTLHEDDFFIVHDSSNVTHGATRVYKAKHKLYVCLPDFDDNAQGYREEIPEFWSQHSTGEFQRKPDSIAQKRIDEYTAHYNKEYGKFRELKYVVCVNDLYYVKPKLISKKEFESGMLISRITVYDLTGRKKLGETVVFGQNEDSVNSQGFHVVGEWGSEMRLKQDLIEKRNKAIYDFLKPVKKAETRSR